MDQSSGGLLTVMRGFYRWMLGTLLISVGAVSHGYAQPKITAKVPTCASIGDAITASYGPISSVEDRTDQVQKLQAAGTTPYSVLRACKVSVPGKKLPLSITIDGPLDRGFLEGMAKMSSSYGAKPQKLDGTGYGDLAYLIPQMGGGNAINSLIGNVVLNLGNSATAQETENMVEHIVRLMR